MVPTLNMTKIVFKFLLAHLAILMPGQGWINSLGTVERSVFVVGYLGNFLFKPISTLLDRCSIMWCFPFQSKKRNQFNLLELFQNYRIRFIIPLMSKLIKSMAVVSFLSSYRFQFQKMWFTIPFPIVTRSVDTSFALLSVLSGCVWHGITGSIAPTSTAADLILLLWGMFGLFVDLLLLFHSRY